MKSRWIGVLGILGFLLGIGWLFWWVQLSQVNPPKRALTLPEEADCLALLTTLGTANGCCLSAEAVQLPQEVDEVFAPYLALQEAQGLPLAQYLGTTAMRYTYTWKAAGKQRIELLLGQEQQLLGAVQYDSTEAETLWAVWEVLP